MASDVDLRTVLRSASKKAIDQGYISSVGNNLLKLGTKALLNFRKCSITNGENSSSSIHGGDLDVDSENDQDFGSPAALPNISNQNVTIRQSLSRCL